MKSEQLTGLERFRAALSAAEPDNVRMLVDDMVNAKLAGMTLTGFTTGPRAANDTTSPPCTWPATRTERAKIQVLAERCGQGQGSAEESDLVIETLGRVAAEDEWRPVGHELDGVVSVLCTRRVAKFYPYIGLEVLPISVMEDGIEAKRHILVAFGISLEARTVVLGLDICHGDLLTAAQTLILGLSDRGLRDAWLVTTDVIPGLRPTLRATLPRAWCQFSVRGVTALAYAAEPPSLGRAVSRALADCMARSEEGGIWGGGWDALTWANRIVLPGLAAATTALESQCTLYTWFPEQHWPWIRNATAHQVLRREIRQSVEAHDRPLSRQAALRVAGSILWDRDEQWAHGRPNFAPATLTAPYERPRKWQR